MKGKVDVKGTGGTLKKWCAILWPIKRNEWQKFFSMAALMFLILLNQNLIRGIKDGLVVNLIGTEVLGFIKLFVEMPVGILFVTIYTLLCNRMKTKNIFRVVILFFLFFFILFGFFLFPYQDCLHPSPSIIQDYIRLYPHLKWFYVMWSKWALVLFYIMGELWPIILFTLLYWQLANKITKVEEASRFYFVFNLFGQINLLFSGSIMVYFSCNSHFLLPIVGSLLGNKTEAVLQVASLIVIVVLLCIFILFFHSYIKRCIMSRQMEQAEVVVAVKLQLGLWKSFKMIAQSKYLWLIFVLMISYSMTINLIEGLWFYEVSLFYKKDSACFIAYEGDVLFWTGIFTLICSILGNAIIQKIGWLGAALITSITTFVIGGCFFLFVVAKYFGFLSETIIGISTLAISVFLGGLQNVLVKGTKYCFFDVTKEMVYIRLSNEMRIKGKAAVDILGAKVGKCAGSIIQIICYTVFCTSKPDQFAPFLMAMFFLICAIWIIATAMLSKEYNKLVAI